MYHEEAETIKRYFQNFAKQVVGQNFHIYDINSIVGGGAGGLNDEKFMKRMLIKPMEEVV
jgi:hypothetical protein